MAWGVCALIHAGFIGIIAWHLLPDHAIHVSNMVPHPETTVELFPAQAFVPAIFFSTNPEHLNPNAAMLYRIEADGTRSLISAAHMHEKREFAFQFEAIADEGTYEIVVLDGENGVVSAPDFFDGEFTGQFPSGDGHPGGSYSARFQIAQKKHEIMTASYYDPSKPLKNAEPAAKAQPKRQEIASPQKSVEKKPPKRENKTTSTHKPKVPKIQEAVTPVPSGIPESTPPSPIAITPEMLRISPMNMAPELTMKSAQTAQRLFEERDTNAFVAAAQLSKKRFESAYNADGPVIGLGQQGNSLSHHKEVEAYLALMHGQIHPLWALGYLLRLDTIYREPTSRLNDVDLEAVLEITLDAIGDVVDVRMVRSSGITDYDSEAIHVAWNASPNEAPPDVMRSPNGKSYIHWTFWRDGRQCGVFGVKVFKNSGSRRDAIEFNLKTVNAHEKKLGLEPSVLQMPPENRPDPKTPLPERINPLED